MLNGVFALVERSLRIDARAWSTHIARLGLVVAIYLSLCMTLTTQFMFGAPGLRFFQWIGSLDLIFVTLLGIGSFSTAITEEKEEDTLGLMMMAGISPLGILVGKSFGRLWQAFTLIAVQYPFMLLAVTLGGVASNQVWAITIAMLAYLAFLSGFGLLCSTLAPRSRSAAFFMILGLIAYSYVPSVARELSVEYFGTTAPRWSLDGILGSLLALIGHFDVFARTSAIMSSGFDESAWTFQVLSNVVMGLMCAGAAWVMFGIATRNPSAEAATRGLLARRRGFLRFTAGHVWSNPFIWKDFHFVAGGIGMLLVRLAFYLGIVFLSLLMDGFQGGSRGEWAAISLMWITLSLPIDAALLVARSMNEEVRGQTLSSLIMLPRSSNGIVHSKLAGAMLGWIPGPIVGICVLVCQLSYSDLSIGPDELSQIIPIVLAGFLYAALVPSYAALAALYVRWGAVPLAIGLTIATYMATSFIVVFLMFATGAFASPMGGLGITGIMTIAILLFGALNAGCHMGVLLRFQALAAK